MNSHIIPYRDHLYAVLQTRRRGGGGIAAADVADDDLRPQFTVLALTCNLHT